MKFSKAKRTIDMFTTLPQYIKYLLITGVVLIVVLMGTTGYFDKMEQSYIAQMREFQEQSELASKYADSLKGQITVQEHKAQLAHAQAQTAQRLAKASQLRTNELRHNLDSLKETITDSTEMARVIIPAQNAVINSQTVTITNQTIAIENLNSAIESKDSTITLLTLSRDSLYQVVTNIPAPPAPPLLPKITRKQVAVGGVVIGILLKAFVF